MLQDILCKCILVLDHSSKWLKKNQKASATEMLQKLSERKHGKVSAADPCKRRRFVEKQICKADPFTMVFNDKTLHLSF